MNSPAQTAQTAQPYHLCGKLVATGTACLKQPPPCARVQLTSVERTEGVSSSARHTDKAKTTAAEPADEADTR